MKNETDSKTILKKLSMFMVGLTILMPLRIVLSCAKYAIRRFRLPSKMVGLFINQLHSPMEMAGFLGTILANVVILFTSNNKCIAKVFSVITNFLMFISSCMLLISYVTGGELGYLTFYYWCIIFFSFIHGCNQSFSMDVDSQNAAYNNAGIPCSGLVTSLYHFIFLKIYNYIEGVNIELYIVTGQLMLVTLLTFVTAVLWIVTHGGPVCDITVEDEGRKGELSRGRREVITTVESSNTTGVDASTNENTNTVGNTLSTPTSPSPHPVSSPPAVTTSNVVTRTHETSSSPKGDGDVSTTNSHVVTTSSDHSTAGKSETTPEKKTTSTSTTDITDSSPTTHNSTHNSTNTPHQTSTTINTSSQHHTNMTTEVTSHANTQYSTQTHQNSIQDATTQGETTQNGPNSQKDGKHATPSHESDRSCYKDLFEYPAVWSPILLCVLTVGLLFFIYPSVLPYEFLNINDAYTLDLIILLISIFPALLIIFLCEHGIGPNVKWVGNNKYWHLTWLFYLPYIGTIVLSLMCLHYYRSEFAMNIKGNKLSVYAMTIIFVLCKDICKGVGYASVSKQGQTENNGFLTSFTYMLTLSVMNIILPLGDGYLKAYKKSDVLNWPTRNKTLSESLLYWIRESLTNAKTTVRLSFTTNIRESILRFE